MKLIYTEEFVFAAVIVTIICLFLYRVIGEML